MMHLSLYFGFDNLVYFNGKGILLIRNPFKAILSAFRHQTVGVHSNSLIALRVNILSAFTHNSKENEAFNGKEFEKFVINHIKVWKEIVEDWIYLGEVLVVHYEEVVDDKMAEVERILRFLNLDIDRRRMECLKYANLDFYRRNTPKLRNNPYTEQLSNIIKKNIDSVNNILVRFGHRGIPYSKYKMH